MKSIFIGMVAIIVLEKIVGHFGATMFLLIEDTFHHQMPLYPPLLELNGVMSLFSLIAYVISGIIVGVIAKKAYIANAILSGVIVWFLYTILEMFDWQYYFKIKHLMPLQWESVIYYGRLGLIVVLLYGIGGFIGSKFHRNKASTFLLWSSVR